MFSINEKKKLLTGKKFCSIRIAGAELDAAGVDA